MIEVAGSVAEVETARHGTLPVVSVIIPVWNVEPYLRQCLDSDLNQTAGLQQLEVIAVDDGSTDGSGAGAR